MGRREKPPFTRSRRRQFWGIIVAVTWSFAAVTIWGSYRHVYHATPAGVGAARHELGAFRWLLVLDDNVTLSGAPPAGELMTRRWVLRPVPIVLGALATAALALAGVGTARFLVARGRLRGRCDECGYDRTGTPPTARCPECGQPPAAAPLDSVGAASD